MRKYPYLSQEQSKILKERGAVIISDDQILPAVNDEFYLVCMYFIDKESSDLRIMISHDPKTMIDFILEDFTNLANDIYADVKHHVEDAQKEGNIILLSLKDLGNKLEIANSHMLWEPVKEFKLKLEEFSLEAHATIQ